MTVALRMSRLHIPTLKEDPTEAEVASHRLLLRSGMIRKAAAGIYTFLPLGWRSVRKIEQIVREEMDAIGSQELLLPFVQPAELWRDSGRWDAYGAELARLTDRQGREFCLGPTHEEIITALVRGEVRSYRDLPLSLYQINLKFRDEIRPRFGLLRGREFIMKDAYSFHDTQESLQEHYDAQSRAYGRICDRLGLTYRPVEADSGQIGGSVTTEFMALAETGEAELVICECGWAANTEAAATVVNRPPSATEPLQTLARISTPNVRTILDLASFLGLSSRETVKTMAAKDSSGRLVFMCIPGNRELNQVKASRAVSGLTLLEEAEFAAFSIPKGSLGPVNAPENTLVVADESLRNDSSWVVGANDEGYHLSGASPARDFTVDLWADLVVAEPGDGCPACGGTLATTRGIEVSQVFQLGTKYSEALGATYTAEDGSESPFLMGCYGVGITRSLAAVIEQHHDDSGITWPISVAPIEVAVIPLSVDDEVVEVAERVWRELADAGVEVIVDDRNERAGVKFADADLIGYPFQLLIGKRGLAAGALELKDRATLERSELPLDRAAELLVARVLAERARYI